MSEQNRYLHDPAFHALVDALFAQVVVGNFTPTDLRDAVSCVETKMDNCRESVSVVLDRQDMDKSLSALDERWKRR